MMSPNVTPTRVLGVLAGRDAEPRSLRDWGLSATSIVAADGAIQSMISQGILPHVVVGDFDSSTPEDRARVPHAVHVPDPDSTDCDKLLGFLAAAGVAEVTLIGVEGDRLDHVLATLHSCARSGLRIRLVLRGRMGYVLGTGERSVAATPGATVSLLPLVECEAVTLTGVRWPLHDQRLSPLGLTSISNEATDAVVRVKVGSGAAVLFIEGPTDPDWTDAEQESGDGSRT